MSPSIARSWLASSVAPESVAIAKRKVAAPDETSFFTVQLLAWMGSLSFDLPERLPRDRYGGVGRGPPGIEREMGDDLDQLVLRDPVLERLRQVERQLV